MRILAVLLVALILALGAGCGGEKKGDAAQATPTGSDGGAASATRAPAATQTAPGTSGGALPDACGTLTEPQVAAAMGEAVAKKSVDPANPAVSRCQWEGATTGRRFVYVIIRAAQFGTSVFNNSFKSRADGQPVSGIGKEAVAIPGQDTPNNYRFLTGAVLTDRLFIQVDVGGPNRSNAEALAALTTVMRTVTDSVR